MMLNVLHVDDEPDIRKVVALALALEMESEIKFRSAASGQEALGVLVSDAQVDVILLDTMTPELDRFLGLDSLAVIIKPFDAMTLGQQLRDHLASA